MDEELGHDGNHSQKNSHWYRHLSWIHNKQQGKEEQGLVEVGR